MTWWWLALVGVVLILLGLLVALGRALYWVGFDEGQRELARRGWRGP